MKTMRSAKIKKNLRRIVQMKKMKVMTRSLKTQKILDRRTPSWLHMSNNKLRRKEECRRCSTRTPNDKCKQETKCPKIRNHVAKEMKVRLARFYKISALPASNLTQTSSISLTLKAWQTLLASCLFDKII